MESINKDKCTENQNNLKKRKSEYDIIYDIQTPHGPSFNRQSFYLKQYGFQKMPLYIWSKSDVNFYVEKVTEILKNRLYLASEEEASNKTVLNRLGMYTLFGNNNQI